MNETTQQNIVLSAKQCFFQHGFKKTTMTMVSDYSGFSRVTVHKHFTSKEQLFLATLEAELKLKFERAENAIRSEYSPWKNIETYLLNIASTIFENIENEFVLQDLHHTFNTIGLELKNQFRARVIQFIEQQIELGSQSNVLSLKASELNPLTISTLVDLCFSGIILNSPLSQIKPQIHHLIRIFKLATRRID